MQWFPLLALQIGLILPCATMFLLECGTNNFRHPWHTSAFKSRSNQVSRIYSVGDSGNHDGRVRSILRNLTLVDGTTYKILAQGQELAPFPEERDKPDEDEVEMLYPTARQYFQFDVQTMATKGNADGEEPIVKEHSTSSEMVQVRTTSFGCGKLGHQVWPSSLALCLDLIHEYENPPGAKSFRQSLPTSVLELGAGCGLPSVTCRDVLKIPKVMATDFWYQSMTEEFDKARLVPEQWHGENLRYNVAAANSNEGVPVDDTSTKTAMVASLDWHSVDTLRSALEIMQLGNSGEVGLDLVIGSDLIYYPMDLEPLWQTIKTLLSEFRVPKVVIMSPLKPDTREALPAFLDLLESKASTVDGAPKNLKIEEDDTSQTDTTPSFDLRYQELILYKSQQDLEDGLEGDRFLKTTLHLRLLQD